MSGQVVEKEYRDKEPRIEILGKMGELKRGKNGGADAKPVARQQ